MRFLFINGPNVNITRFTEPGVEGEVDYNGLLDYLDVCCQQMGIEPDFFQSNHEGDIIDEIQSAAGRADGIILNPGGYAYYSVAILEALQLCGVPAVEVLSGPLGGRGHRRLSPRMQLSGAAAPAGRRRTIAHGAIRKETSQQWLRG